MTLLGSSELLRTAKKQSFITSGQRKNVLCLWYCFHPSKGSSQSFLWISKSELTERWAGCTQRVATPEQKPCYLTHEETGEGTREMPVDRKNKRLPTLSLLQLWPVFIMLCTF